MVIELFRFTESIPSNAGYSNYYYFTEGSIVYILNYGYRKYCVLCDEQGRNILEDGHKVVMCWSPEFSDFPVWEDKLEPYRTIDVMETPSLLSEDEEEDEESSSSLPVGIEVISLMETLECLDDYDMIYLDTDGSILQKCIEKYGEDNVFTIMENDSAQLIAVMESTTDTEVPTSSDVDDLLNSIDDIEAITVNFNKQ